MKPREGFRTCLLCRKTKEASGFTKNPKANGGHFYSFNCNVCIYKKTKKSLLTTLDVAVNNFLSGSDKWTQRGVVMNLAKPTFQLRVPM